MKNILLVLALAVSGCATVGPNPNENIMVCPLESLPPIDTIEAEDVAKRYEKEITNLYKALADCQAGR